MSRNNHIPSTHTVVPKGLLE
ncbi:unnamed protein product [Tuber melanosporum]|uniref:(Perigord truffle) hypothetical protein n=1 Tax=Tuber melanosporum (strain Mel28) TaxID=656061 RepID=D5GP23_TUBMM|nr:unnamed protein product [Tuber melanosporum]